MSERVLQANLRTRTHSDYERMVLRGGLWTQLHADTRLAQAQRLGAAPEMGAISFEHHSLPTNLDR